MKIVLVEDDPLQIQLMADLLDSAFGASVSVIINESDFMSRVDEFVYEPPDAFIIDVILRWSNPKPDMILPPSHVDKEGRERAGFRCQELLAKNPLTRDIPVVLCSTVGVSHFERQVKRLPENAVFVPKDNLTLICEAVRRLTGTVFE